MSPSDAATIVGEHFATYNWLVAIENGTDDLQERHSAARAYFETLKDINRADYDTVVDAFGGADEQTVDAMIAEKVTAGFDVAWVLQYYQNYRDDLTNGLSWSVEDLIDNHAAEAQVPCVSQGLNLNASGDLAGLTLAEIIAAVLGCVEQ